MKSWRVFCVRCLGLATWLFAAAGCGSLDDSTPSSSSAPTKTTVPGEVNPDAPDAAQNVRTTPGWNF